MIEAIVGRSNAVEELSNLFLHKRAYAYAFLKNIGAKVQKNLHMCKKKCIFVTNFVNICHFGSFAVDGTRFDKLKMEN